MTEVSITFKVTNEMSMSLSNYLSLNPNIKNQSELIREIIGEFLSKTDENFLRKKINEYKKVIESLKESEKIIKLKKDNLKKIPQKEIEFLLISQEKLEKNPKFLYGIIESYCNVFKKAYKINEQEFFKLINGAEKQCKKKNS